MDRRLRLTGRHISLPVAPRVLLPDFVEPCGPGVYALDTGYVRPRFDACYLIVDAGRAAFVDTGTALAAPRCLAALQALGLSREAVDWVIPTHVHLDHAGGCGNLMQALPRARLLVHPRGARHLIDPAVLWQSTVAVYGEAEARASYGEVLPVDAGRTVVSADGMCISVGARELRLIDTPGHARHHHCIWDAASRGWFVGDTFGLCYPEFASAAGPCILLAATPTQFDPEAWKYSLDRLLASAPQQVYVTHYGPVGQVPALARQLKQQIERFVALARATPPGPDRTQRLRAGVERLLLDFVREAASPMTEAAARERLAMDIELNTQGLGIWMEQHA